MAYGPFFYEKSVKKAVHSHVKDVYISHTKRAPRKEEIMTHLIQASTEVSFLNSLQNVSMTQSEKRSVFTRILAVIPVLMVVIGIKLFLGA